MSKTLSPIDNNNIYCFHPDKQQTNLSYIYQQLNRTKVFGTCFALYKTKDKNKSEGSEKISKPRGIDRP